MSRKYMSKLSASAPAGETSPKTEQNLQSDPSSKIMNGNQQIWSTVNSTKEDAIYSFKIFLKEFQWNEIHHEYPLASGKKGNKLQFEFQLISFPNTTCLDHSWNDARSMIIKPSFASKVWRSTENFEQQNLHVKVEHKPIGVQVKWTGWKGGNIETCLMFSGNHLDVPFDGTLLFKNRAGDTIGTLRMQAEISLSSIFHVDRGLIKQLPFGIMQCKTFTTRNDPKKLTSFSQAWMTYMSDMIEIKFINQANIYFAESTKNALNIWYVRKEPEGQRPQSPPELFAKQTELPVTKA